MEVYIAEKPSLARAIADGLGVRRKEDAHIVCEGGNLVTWCFGHILQDCMPEDYDPAWKVQSLHDRAVISRECDVSSCEIVG